MHLFCCLAKCVSFINQQYRTVLQIRVLEVNIQKAEVEICRLDELVEKIRFVSSFLIVCVLRKM